MPDDLIARAEAVMEGVSAEPWHIPRSGQGIDSGKYGTVIERGNVECMSYCYGGTSTIEGDNLDADLRFIAAARSLVPELVDALKTARAEVDRLKTCLSDAYYVVAEKQAENERLAAELEAARVQLQQQQEAANFADSILSLLRYRGLVDSEQNRRDVQKASEMLERLRADTEVVTRKRRGNNTNE